ncbi:type 1 glutamine amidotransferase domain-containing protein [Rhizobium laguerreae]|uniref:type 1 glutamine amidotransferase domain-containing protein n=1 Tax=Rhizobium laguerreae TaxID=1076926 RepID=UPI001C8FE076|nr:type 1 glutamine amidotransferase domain-containing protein [Rhizobium laguerreae]MBY3217751.1 type 1 glutamine amidotransferase domain-containing protein [Rhizobium laguerreae]
MSKIVIVLTSHTQLGDTGKPTGFYFEEMAAPYWALMDAGHEVDIASISGGAAVHDPSSMNVDPAKRPAPVVRFMSDAAAMAKLSNTRPLGEIDPSGFDGVFLAGGHGTMFDFPENEFLGRIVGSIYDTGGIIGAVCHGPAGLMNARRADGMPIVAGQRVSSFTDAEEEAVGLAEVMPFLLESRLRDLGALFEGAGNFQAHAVLDRRLVTGQNPASAPIVAEKLVEALASLSKSRLAGA